MILAALFCLSLAGSWQLSAGHGLMTDPPSRNTMWRQGFSNPANFDDMGLNCGGLSNQWDVNGGRCGVCGDPYQGPLKHQAGYQGKGYANGIIGKTYKQGSVIEVTAKITANHLGYITYKICPVNDKSKKVTQHCLDKYPLSDVNGKRKFVVYDYIKDGPGLIKVSLKLPDHLTCSQCVIQWVYRAGNNAGGENAPQETFQNCADVAITIEGDSNPKPVVKENKVTRRLDGVTKYDENGNSQGQWDCDVMKPFNKPDIHQKIYDWCIRGCIEAKAEDRDCPASHCSCYQVKSPSGTNTDRYRPYPKHQKPHTHHQHHTPQHQITTQSPPPTVPQTTTERMTRPTSQRRQRYQFRETSPRFTPYKKYSPQQFREPDSFWDAPYTQRNQQPYNQYRSQSHGRRTTPRPSYRTQYNPWSDSTTRYAAYSPESRYPSTDRSIQRSWRTPQYSAQKRPSYFGNPEGMAARAPSTWSSNLMYRGQPAKTVSVKPAKLHMSNRNGKCYLKSSTISGTNAKNLLTWCIERCLDDDRVYSQWSCPNDSCQCKYNY